MSKKYDNVTATPRIGSYSFDEYVRLAESFHGYAAPGIILGGFMVDFALKNLPDGELFDVICETSACLPDAVQILTPCTLGNGWLRVLDYTRYALTVYEKQGGEGVRIAVDSSAVRAWPEFRSWFFKLKPKKDQDTKKLMAEIKEAGYGVCTLQRVEIDPDMLVQKSRGCVEVCPLCNEAFRTHSAKICPACKASLYYRLPDSIDREDDRRLPELRSRAVETSVGFTTLHDMTRIVPGQLKKAEFKEGGTISVGDICRLQRMGKRSLYLREENPVGSDWVHEDKAAVAFAEAMKGDGVTIGGSPVEGRVNLEAAVDGLMTVEVEWLNRFNRVPDVMCSSLKRFTQVTRGQSIGATRAIPLFLSRENFLRAMDVMNEGPLFKVLPMRKATVGIIVTGNEIFKGLVQDQFIPIIREKLNRFDCRVIAGEIVRDDRTQISEVVKRVMEAGADMIVVTAGMSVDPDDVTRQAIMDAGATDIVYGAPILPGAMTLLARIGKVQVVGVPACALYFKITSFDMLLPRLLAGLDITRDDLARMGHGAFCMNCEKCVFPKCPVGR